ncbi:MAG: hypothetical protein WC551_11595 [Patescibacteria group bacterium]
MRQITDEQYQIIVRAWEAGIDAARRLQTISQMITDNDECDKEAIFTEAYYWPTAEAMDRLKVMMDSLLVVETPES